MGFQDKLKQYLSEDTDAAGIDDSDFTAGSGYGVDDTNEPDVPTGAMYYVLFEATGTDADRLINTVETLGADTALTQILNTQTISEPSDDNVEASEPWDSDDNTYQDDDLVLWWDDAHSIIGIAQVDDTDDEDYPDDDDESDAYSLDGNDMDDDSDYYDTSAGDY